MEFRAAAPDWLDEVSIIACERNYTTNKIGFVANPVQFEMAEYQPHAYLPNPTLRLKREEAVQLMDALWLVGLRPSEYKSASGEIQRLEAHIADLRKIAFPAAGQGA